MAFWTNIQTQLSSPIKIANGINTAVPASDISRNEASYLLNTSSQYYPWLATRQGRQYYSTAITGNKNALGVYLNGYIHVLDGTTWKKWTGAAYSTVVGSMSNERSNFIEYNNGTNKYIILVNSTNMVSYNGTATSAIAAAPKTRFYCVDDYRLYALKDNAIINSAAGSITDWTTVLNAATNYCTDSKGAATGITKYNDTVIAFFENSMHLMYGNDPYDFYIPDPLPYGCCSDRAILHHENRLYFLDLLNNSLMVYDGGSPSRISYKVKTYIDGINASYSSLCAMGKQDKYIYLSIPYGTTTNNLTLEYDTQYDIWNVHNVGYVAFVNSGKSLIAIDNNGQTWTINSGTDDNGSAISWQWISGVINYGTIARKKSLIEMHIGLDLPATSTLSIYYSESYDGSDFTLLSTFIGSSSEQISKITVPFTQLQHIDKFRLKFIGTGPCKIEALEELFKIKAR